MNMKRILASLALALGLVSSAIAQTTPTLPANTVYGRLGIGPGPAQAIPFSVISTNLLSSLCTPADKSIPIYNAATAQWVCTTIGSDFAVAFGGNLNIGTNAVGYTKQAQAAANTVTGNFTSSTANKQDTALPSCSTSTSALQYTTSVGFGCGTISAGLPSGWVASAAVANGKFLNNGSITSGAKILTSTATCVPRNCASFVSGDVGKTIQCTQNGTAAQAVFSDTIASFQSSTQVTLTNNSPFTAAGTASCQWGTDNTTTINNEIASLTQSGTLLLPTGYVMVSSINGTGRATLAIRGASGGVNNVITNTYPGTGTVLIGTQGTFPLIDLTASNQPILEDLQVGHIFSPVTGKAGIFFAQDNTGSVFAERLIMNRVYVSGFWSVAAFHAYGAAFSSARDSKFQNYGANPIAVRLDTNNIPGVTSNYRTVASGIQGRGGGALYNVEIHASAQPDAVNNGVGLYALGHIEPINGVNVSIDAQNHGSVRIEPDSGAGIAANWSFKGLNIYSEGTQISEFCWVVTSGTFAVLWLDNYTKSCTTGKSGNVTNATVFIAP